MKITKIEYQKNSKDKCNVYIDGNYMFSLSVTTFIKKNLKEGDDLLLSEINTLLEEDKKEKAYIYILNYLKYGDRTTLEVKKQLKKKGYTEEVIQTAIQKAVDSKVLDDERYCDNFVYSRLNSSKPDGPQKITALLMSKGISKSLIQEKISYYLDHNNEKDKIRQLIEKKLKTLSYKNKFDLKSKLFRYIGQKGFNIDDVIVVIDDVVSELTDENIE